MGKINIKKINLNYKHYFFDFFGTIILRKNSESAIKKIWSARLSKYLNCLLSTEKIYLIRCNSELFLSGKNNFEYTYREMIDVVYERIKAILLETFTFDIETFYALCKKIELEVESDNQLLNKDIIDTIEYLAKKNKKLYILSDFYLEEKDIAYFLSKKGVDASIFHKIFVSCELRCNKLNGDAYTKVVSLLQISPNTCYMIGDNKFSDGKNAKINGFESYIVRPQIKKTKKSCLELLGNCLTTEKKFGMSYANYALDLFYFTHKLYYDLKKEGFKKVFFFAREGEFLKKLFDNYCITMQEKLGFSKIESTYLFVSRQATFPATLKPLNEENFGSLFKEYKDLSVSSFLKNIGFSDLQIKNCTKDFKTNIECLIDNFSMSIEFQKLKQDKLFLQYYEKNRLLSKENLKIYLTKKGFFDNGKVAVVDIGWKGSIQDNLKLAIGENLTICGYYYGLTNQTRGDLSNSKKGLIFHYYPDVSRDINAWEFDANFFERLLTASHASTSGYIKTGNGIEPVFNEFSAEQNNYLLVAPLQEKMLIIFKKLSLLIIDLPLTDEELYQFVKKWHVTTCCKVCLSNIKLKKTLLEGQLENFGYQKLAGERNKQVFSLKNILRNFKKILRAFKRPILLANFFMIKNMPLVSVCIFRTQYRRLLK